MSNEKPFESSMDDNYLHQKYPSLPEIYPESSNPGQQDLAVEPSIGHRSPLSQGGAISPNQGRSVREFDDQMANLRKENFNLKLRIFFLEEKIPGYKNSSNSENTESVIKENIDLKVTTESLRQELKSKQDLLQEAARAINSLETKLQQAQAESHKIIDDLYHKIKLLEMENKEINQYGNENNLDDLSKSDFKEDFDAVQKIRELEGYLQDYKETNVELHAKIAELEEEMQVKNKKIDSLEESIRQTEFQNEELQEQLEIKKREISNSEKLPKAKDELKDYKRQVADNACIIEELEAKLKEKNAAYEKSLKIILKLAPTQFKNSKNSETVSLLSQVKEDVKNLNIDISNNEEYAAEIAVLQSKLKERDDEIEKLKLEVRKKTSNLQDLVNTELWEKNREIERLMKLLNKSNTNQLSSYHFSFPPSSPIHENDQLQLAFTDTEYNRAIKRNKYLQEKLELLIEKIITTAKSSEKNLDSEKLVRQLKEDLKKVREEADNTNRWQKQYAEVCTILTSRLEELAGFLDSLLKHKDVLDNLAVDKRRAIRKAVDKSLDLSRSINLNGSLVLSRSTNSASIIGEENLTLLTNISCLLNMVSVDNSLNNETEDNKENKDNNRYEDSLKEQTQMIEYLKSEVKALRTELDRKKNADGSSRKDHRSVSSSLLTADIYSESETWSEPDREVSLARIGLEEPKGSSQLKNKCDTKLKLASSESETGISTKTIAALKFSSQNKDEKFGSTELNELLKDYKKVNEKLEIEIATFKDRYENTVSELATLQKELNKKATLCALLNREKEQYRTDANKLKSQLTILKETFAEQENIYKSEIEKANKKLAEAKEEYVEILNEKLKQQEEMLREKITREAKNTYKDIQSDLEATNRKLKEASFTIEFLRENEADLKKTLLDNEKLIRNLKQNANDLAVQISKSVHDRTMAITDRIALEQKVDELKYKISVVEREKAERITKLSETENLLVKRDYKIKLLEQNLEQLKSARLAHQSSSEAYQSGGYTSEEIAKKSLHVINHLDVNINSSHQNRKQNSSPDLGIESDTAKTSSVELSAIQTPLLKTIEFTAASTISAENGLNAGGIEGNSENLIRCVNNVETNNTVTATATCLHYHDCEKIQKENFELRRKLNRTRRAFEDTYTKLQNANHRKEKIERDIKQQIQKTQRVLKSVRSNMESELVEHKKKEIEVKGTSSME